VRALEELGIDYFCCGHYNTERFGVGNLCRLIDERFDVPTWFVDIANPV